MAIALGNITDDKNNVSGTTKDFTHNQNTGDDGHLFIFVLMDNTTTVSDVTYDSVSATPIIQYVTTSNDVRHELWEIDGPSTGINTLEVTFAASAGTLVQVVAYSFTGCSGYGNRANLQTAGPPISSDLYIADNSIIIAQATGDNSSEAITINSSGRTLDYSEGLSSGANTFGATSETGLSKGNITCEANCGSATSLMLIEAREVGAKALTVGNKTIDLGSPGGGTTRTFSHNMSTGSDGYLYVSVGHSQGGSPNLTGVTYNGVSMTLLHTRISGIGVMVCKIYGLAAPATGSNNVVLTFDGAMFSNVSSHCISFTGCSGAGNFADSGTENPASVPLSVSANSCIVGQCVSTPGTARTMSLPGSIILDFDHNNNNQRWGGIGALGLTAGSKTCTASQGDATPEDLTVAEMQEAAAVAAARRIFIC